MKPKALVKVPLVLTENLIFSLFPGLRPIIERYGFNPLDFRSDHTEYSLRKFEEFRSSHPTCAALDGKILLELGPGGSIGFGLLALQAGLKRYFAIDDGTHTFIAPRLLAEYKRLLGNDEKLIERTFAKDRSGKTRYAENIISFKEINQKARYPLPDDSVDIIYSCAVLEHVHDLDLAFSEMTRVLRTNGIMYHEVDLRDHIFDQESLWFLTIPDRWFRLLFSRTGGYVNRKRLSTYQALAERFGFEILSLTINKRLDPTLAQQVPDFLSGTDREVLTFSFVLKKN